MNSAKATAWSVLRLQREQSRGYSVNSPEATVWTVPRLQREQSQGYSMNSPEATTWTVLRLQHEQSQPLRPETEIRQCHNSANEYVS